ncbi:MAG: YbjN domain-containing protein [Armatimonadetes bacterium]|nr:YbjN domain-containing protein [Armatimonadota bacterium]
MTTRYLRCVALVAAVATMPVLAAAKKTVTTGNQPTPPMRQVAEQAMVHRSVSLEELEAACDAAGLSPKAAQTGGGDPCLLLEIDGASVALVPDGADGKYTSLTIHATFEVDHEADPSVANSWNLEKRFTAACAKDKQYILKSDLDLAGGVTSETATRWIDTFKQSIAAFAEHVKG